MTTTPEHLAAAITKTYPGMKDTEVRRLVAAAQEEAKNEAADKALMDFQPFEVSFIESGLTIRSRTDSHIMTRGQVLKVSSEIYQYSLDADGRSCFDYNDEEQMKRFGKVMFRKGGWKLEYGPRLERTSLEWDRERREAFRHARSLPTVAEQTAALHEAAAYWGSEPVQGGYR